MRGEWIREFREFVLRGNLVDLAVAVVIGTAFTAVVTALVKDIITPLIAALGGKPDFGDLRFTINDSVFRYGDFLNALLSFLILATVVFFFVVKPVNHLMQRFATEPDVDTPTRKCPECLSEIPEKARRCAFCTAQLARELRLARGAAAAWWRIRSSKPAGRGSPTLGRFDSFAAPPLAWPGTQTSGPKPARVPLVTTPAGPRQGAGRVGPS